MKTYALGISYLGTHYQGWQTQPSGLGVQDQLEQALSAFACVDLPTFCAGRTDSGVHALEQVVHFQTQLERVDHSWVRGVNAFLPKDIRIRWVQAVSHDFHARFSAQSRTYVYILYNDSLLNPLWNHRAGWFHRPLNLKWMQEALSYLIGEHDFSAFRASQCQAHTPIRTLEYAHIEQRGRVFILVLRANAFLYHMVRNIVGTLVYIGQGKYPASWILDLLKEKDRKKAPPTFMPDGLYFAQAHYPERYELPSLFDLSRPLESILSL